MLYKGELKELQVKNLRKKKKRVNYFLPKCSQLWSKVKEDLDSLVGEVLLPLHYQRITKDLLSTLSTYLGHCEQRKEWFSSHRECTATSSTRTRNFIKLKHRGGMKDTELEFPWRVSGFTIVTAASILHNYEDVQTTVWCFWAEQHLRLLRTDLRLQSNTTTTSYRA